MSEAPVCIIDGCMKKARTRGWCGAHYYRWLRHGTPLGGRTGTNEARDYLREVALRSSDGQCIAWPYSTDRNGYAQITISGKTQQAYRVVCELVNGAPPGPAYDAAHSCGNGHLGCVNPRHLKWKTRSHNLADRIGHGTANRGERHGLSKLTKADVLAIRRLKGTMPQKDIAKKFGVSAATITRTQSGETWGWLK